MELIQKNKIVTFKTSGFKDDKILKKALTFRDPTARFMTSYQNGRWDGTRKYFDKRRKTFSFGFLNQVKKMFRKYGVMYTLQTNLTGEYELKDLDPRLYEHQKKAVQAAFKHRFGIIKIPTRGGKTFTSAEITRQIILNNSDAKINFFVDNVDLFNQTVREYSAFLKIEPHEIGQIQGKPKGDTFVFKQINVMMIQTVSGYINPTRKNKKDDSKMKLTEQLLNHFANTTALFIDEVQEFSSDKRINVIEEHRNLDFLISLSATPFKSEQGSRIANLNLMQAVGDVIYEVKEEGLKEKKVLAEDKVILILFEGHGEDVIKELEKKSKILTALEKYQEFKKDLVIHNKNRNNLLKDCLTVCKELKLKTLVLFNSVEHGEIFANKTRHSFISGKTKSIERETKKNRFLKRKQGGVLLASDIFKKGVTLPEAQVMISGDNVKEQSLVLQKRGRVIGSAENKSEALTIDVIDNVKFYDKQAIERIKAYEKVLSKENIDVLTFKDKESFVIELYDKLQKWFNL